MSEGKVCSTCGLNKPVVEFAMRSDGARGARRRDQCRECRLAKGRVARCVDCGRPVVAVSTRCRECYLAHHHETAAVYRCVDCGTVIRTKSERCPSCNGRANMARRFPPELVDQRFWAQVDRGSRDGCWRWTGLCQGMGYGYFCRGAGEMVLAHRYAWERSRGPLDTGMVLHHRCMEPLCVNPAHLEALSHRDHMGVHARLRRGEAA